MEALVGVWGGDEGPRRAERLNIGEAGLMVNELFDGNNSARRNGE